MPQAIPALAPIMATATGAFIVNTITTVLINYAIGGMSFRDERGELWIACDDE